MIRRSLVDILLPAKIPIPFLFGFVVVLALSQIILGTDLFYICLLVIFILLTVTAVNSLGGMQSVLGFSVALMALKIVIISQVAKVFFLEPADTNLEMPERTLAVMVVGILGILVAAMLTRRMKRKKYIFRAVHDPRRLKIMAWASFFIGASSFLYSTLFGFDEAAGEIRVGGLLSITRYLIFLLPVAVVCSTAWVLTESRNTKSMNLFSGTTILMYFLVGFLQTSKTAMYEPFLYYFLTCIAFGYRFRKTQIVALLLVFAVSFTILHSYAQIARSFTRGTDIAKTFSLTVEFVKLIARDKSAWEEVEGTLASVETDYVRFQYYDKPVEVLNRFSLIEQVDELVYATEIEGATGWETILPGFRMIFPRFILPDKPKYNTGNFLGHRIGILAAGDFTTQISFGFIAEAYSAFKWVGAFLIPLMFSIPFFVIYGKLFGTLKNNIWTVFVFGQVQHWFVETSIAGFMLQLTQGIVVLLVIYFFLMTIAQLLHPERELREIRT